MTAPLFRTLWADIRCYHSKRFPTRAVTTLSALRVILASPGFQMLAAHRLAHHRRQARLHANLKGFDRLWLTLLARLGRPLQTLVAKSQIMPDADIGEGVWLSDRGHIVLGAFAVGDGTVIQDRVTIGTAYGNRLKRPTIGRNVWIGPNCVIYGGIEVGDGVTILPNTVLSKNVLQSGLVLQGNPPRIVRKGFDNAALRASPQAEAGPHLART